MTERRHRYLLLFVSILLSACVRYRSCPCHEGSGTSSLYVVHQGLHTGFAFDRTSMRRTEPPWLTAHKGNYVEIGWGDAEYYPHESPGMCEGLGALLTPGPSVIHVVTFDVAPERFFSGGDVIVLQVKLESLQRLIAFIDTQFEHPPVAIVAGDYADSHFYRAKGRFHLFHNCNDWTIEALNAMGCDIKGGWIVSARGLMGVLREKGCFGVRWRAHSVPLPNTDSE